MQLDIRTISQSDVTGGKNPVVVEGFHPELIPYLEDSFVIFQRCEDQEDYFTSEESVLNALKPKIYITDSLDKFDSDLCKSFGCDIFSIRAFMENGSKEASPIEEAVANLDEPVTSVSSLPTFMLDVEEADLNNPPGLKSPDIWNIQLKSADLPIDSSLSEGTEHDN